MKKYAMVVDSSVCIDCKACMVSCKVQNRVPAGHCGATGSSGPYRSSPWAS